MSKAWYGFSIGEVTDTTRYFRIQNGINHCLCGTTICAVYVTGGNIHPELPFSKNISQYIQRAISTGQLQPDQPINSKKFVYLKY